MMDDVSIDLHHLFYANVLAFLVGAIHHVVRASIQGNILGG